MSVFKRSAFCAAIALPLLATSVSAQDISIAYGAYSPPTSDSIDQGIKVFLDSMKEMSNGSIDYELFAGGVMVADRTTLAGVRDGLVDGAQIATIYFPSELPQNSLITNLSPALTADARAVSAAVTEFVLLNCEDCMEELRGWNIEYLGGYAISTYDLICVEPAETMADLSGRTVRAAGSLGPIATTLGMVPVNLGQSEAYEGLQRGQLDCTLGSPGALQSFSYGDVAKNVILIQTSTPFGGPYYDLSLDIWGQMSDEQKAIAYESAAKAQVSAASAFLDTDQAAIDSADENGYAFIEPGPDVQAALEEYREGVVEEVIANGEAAGIADAETKVRTFLDIVEKWSGIVAESDENDAIVQAMMSEIYDKL